MAGWQLGQTKRAKAHNCWQPNRVSHSYQPITKSLPHLQCFFRVKRTRFFLCDITIFHSWRHSLSRTRYFECLFLIICVIRLLFVDVTLAMNGAINLEKDAKCFMPGHALFSTSSYKLFVCCSIPSVY